VKIPEIPRSQGKKKSFLWRIEPRREMTAKGKHLDRETGIRENRLFEGKDRIKESAGRIRKF